MHHLPSFAFVVVLTAPGPIEKGANDGQLSYANSLSNSLRATVASGKSIKAMSGKAGKGRRRAQAPTADDTTVSTAAQPTSTTSKPAEPDWGLFEPLRPLLSPITDPISSLLSQKSFTGLLLLLLLWTLLFRSPSSSAGRDVYPTSSAERIAAYEQIWRAEEAELWKWMEERVAGDRMQDVVGRRVSAAVQMQERLRDEGMLERQVEEAMRVTEEKLGVLKRVVEREKVAHRSDEKKEQTKA